MIDVCRENDITLFCLPPHTTHALQPLDVAVFKSLKDSFAEAVRELSFTRKNFIVSKRESARVVKCPLDQAFSTTNVKSGFTKCGIYPFKPDAVAKNKMIPSAVHQVTGSSSDTCSDCVPESSASESAVPSSVMPLSSESPSNEISRDPNVSQEAVSATSSSLPRLSTSIAVVAASPPPTVCTSSVNVTTTIMSPSSSVSSFSPVNPLVCAGLVPEDLSDILVTASSDAAVAKKRTKRIVGARHLTSDEYVEMVKSEERKKKEAEDLKEQKKVERERKKIERENEKKNKLEKQAARRKEMENRKRKQLAERGKGRERKKKCLETPSVPMESDSESSEVEKQRSYSEPDSADQESEDDDRSTQPGPCRLRQHGILPARFSG